MPRGPSSVASDCAMCSIAPLVSLYAANSGWDCHSTPELTITMLPRVCLQRVGEDRRQPQRRHHVDVASPARSCGGRPASAGPSAASGRRWRTARRPVRTPRCLRDKITAGIVALDVRRDGQRLVAVRRQLLRRPRRACSACARRRRPERPPRRCGRPGPRRARGRSRPRRRHARAAARRVLRAQGRGRSTQHPSRDAELAGRDARRPLVGRHAVVVVVRQDGRPGRRVPTFSSVGPSASDSGPSRRCQRNCR